jgi:hypothetical protein
VHIIDCGFGPLVRQLPREAGLSRRRSASRQIDLNQPSA